MRIIQAGTSAAGNHYLGIEKKRDSKERPWEEKLPFAKTQEPFLRVQTLI